MTLKDWETRVSAMGMLMYTVWAFINSFLKMESLSLH